MRKLRFKLVGIIFIVFVGIIFVSACSNNQANGKKGKDEKVKFSIMAVLHTPDTPSERIEKLIEEKTGVELKIDWVPAGTYGEKLNTAFSTQTLPEVTYLGNITTFLRFKEAMRDGQFWEIGPYIDEYPNLKNLNQQILDNTRVDGKLYTLYQGRPLSRQGLIYRKDWADHLGLKEPTTIDEFYEMARAFTENDPDGNGKNDTFGLTDRSDLVYGAFKSVASWLGTPNGWGEKDGQLLPEFMFDEYIETMNLFKDLRDHKYINQDFPVTSKDDQQAFIKNGTAGMYVGAMDDVLRIYNDAIELNPDAEFEVANQIKGPDGEFGIWALPGYGQVIAFSKSAIKDEETLKGILGFYNQLLEPEMTNLLYWGIEDEHYHFNDGKALAVDDGALVDREVKPYQSLEIGEPATNGRYDGMTEYDVREKADQLILDNENYLIHDPTASLDSATFIERGEILNTQMADATYQYILGKTNLDGFEKAIEDWKKGGGEQIIAEFNESWEKSK